MTPEQMDEVFGNEANYNVSTFPDAAAEFPDGTEWFICTNWAHYVRRVLGDRAEIYGFDDESNPTSLIAQESGGHDFAVVDGRYIVDGWAKNVEQHIRCAVLDLDNPEHAAKIVELYGDRSKWDRGDANEAMIDRETPEERAAAMEGTRFPGFEAPAPSL